MRYTSWIRCGVAALVVFGAVAQRASAQEEDRSDIETSGDYLTILLPATGLAASLLHGPDWEGTKQLTFSVITSQAIVETFKFAGEKWRPNAANARSFPSGHSAGAWTGASFLNTRYGPYWGVPAFALAAWTSYTRVHAEKHFVDDVISGASVALFTNWALVTPYSDEVAFTPTYDGNSIGFNFVFGAAAPDAAGPGKDDSFVAKWKYEWAFGSFWSEENLIQAPSGVGTLFDMSTFDRTSNPTTIADFTITRYLEGGHTVFFRLLPYDRRDFGGFSSPASFAGVLFPANTEIRSEYRLWVYTLGYLYTAFENDDWQVQAGGGLQVEHASAALATPTLFANASDTAVWPILIARGRWKISRKFSASAEASGMFLSGDQTWAASAWFTWHIHPRWEASVGWAWGNRDVDASTLLNDFTAQRALIIVGYAW